MNHYSVRLATSKDAAIIATCNRKMALETEGKDLREQVINNGVRRLMKRPEYGFYVMAECDNNIAGTLMITTEWSDWRDGLFWWIQSVYVMPEYRRQGVYSAMYAFIKQRAATDPDVCGYRLYVEQENTVAQKTYQALGMHDTHYQLYEELCDDNEFLD